MVEDPKEKRYIPIIELERIRRCFDADRVFYSAHARREMREEEFGLISDNEVAEVINSGEIIKSYPEDTPYPSVLIFGTTSSNRPLHSVCAYNREDDQIVVVTVYQPDPDLWEGFRRRKDR